MGMTNEADLAAAGGSVMESATCISCGDLIGDDSDQPPDVQDQMKVRCRACAMEVLGIAVPFVGTLQHDTGGGRRVIRESKTH